MLFLGGFRPVFGRKLRLLVTVGETVAGSVLGCPFSLCLRSTGELSLSNQGAMSILGDRVDLVSDYYRDLNQASDSQMISSAFVVDCLRGE